MQEIQWEAGLPAGMRSRMIDNVHGLSMHILEAGFDEPGRPCVLMLHGFPELAYSWRKVMPALAAAGYHVVAPDQRGYGRTTGWLGDYDDDLAPFRLLSLTLDVLALVTALGRHSVAAVVGHDFGSPVAAWCALTHPEVFRSLVLMSAPFAGVPRRMLQRAVPAVPAVSVAPARTAEPAVSASSAVSASPAVPAALVIPAALAALDPPRKHYQWYYSTPEADANMRQCPQGVHAFLRAYYHCKSADWTPNRPFPLKSWSAAELAKMPTYYIMNLAEGMAETVAPHAPSAAQIAACTWLPDSELRVYSETFARTGFQGGLQWYRNVTDPQAASQLLLFAGTTIDVPSCFIAGKSDWGVYQSPGAFEAMPAVCTRMRDVHLIEGAGHWVQQEQPEIVSQLLLKFLADNASVSDNP